MEIGKKIKWLREERNLSLRELARLAHISHSFIADIESGRSNPSLDTLQSLAKALGVSVSDITDDPRPSRNTKIPPDIRKIARAGQKMTPEQREQWLKVAEVLFPEAFKEE